MRLIADARRQPPRMGLAAAPEHAVRYYNDFCEAHQSVRRAHRFCEAAKALEDLRDQLEKHGTAGWDAEAVAKTEVFAVRERTFSTRLRDCFTALYEVLFGRKQGPRFGGFIALYGWMRTVALDSTDALAGQL